MRKNGSRKPRIVARLLAALLVVGMVSPGRGAPSDVFESAAPMLGSDPPKAEALRDGDSSVSTQTGSFNYSYPITVPPGRQGNEPSLALSYSSQGANYGGIAAGWSLSIPEIRRDTSGGILDQIDGTQITRAGMRFVSSLAGSRPLIETDEPKASNIRKNQKQVDQDGNLRGDNRPDVQYDKDDCHHCVEFDTDPRNADKHAKTINDNDPDAAVQLREVKKKKTKD